MEEEKKICLIWKYAYGEKVPECDICKHYGCEAYRYLKREDDDHD